MLQVAYLCTGDSGGCKREDVPLTLTAGCATRLLVIPLLLHRQAEAVAVVDV